MGMERERERGGWGTDYCCKAEEEAKWLALEKRETRSPSTNPWGRFVKEAKWEMERLTADCLAN